MEKLSLTHFQKQVNEEGTHREKLFYVLEIKREGSNVYLELCSYCPEDNVPEYKFVRYSGKDNMLPYVKKMTK